MIEIDTSMGRSGRGRGAFIFVYRLVHVRCLQGPWIVAKLWTGLCLGVRLRCGV